jgi:hypothetical protein
MIVIIISVIWFGHAALSTLTVAVAVINLLMMVRKQRPPPQSSDRHKPPGWNWRRAALALCFGHLDVQQGTARRQRQVDTAPTPDQDDSRGMTSRVQWVGRVRPVEAGSERETLTGKLDILRSAVVNKVAGLTDEQAFWQAIPSSPRTPAGIVKYLTGVERFWFGRDFAGADLPWPWPEDDPDGNVGIAAEDTLTLIVGEYVQECERSRRVVDGRELSYLAQGPGMTFSLRFALAHVIEETARHCGYLELLRERIDGSTSQ